MMKANKYKFVGPETVVQYFSSHAHIARSKCWKGVAQVNPDSKWNAKQHLFSDTVIALVMACNVGMGLETLHTLFTRPHSTAHCGQVITR